MPDPWEEIGPPEPSRLERRRQRIRDEIARNRRGEYVVPTWVLTAALVLLVGAAAAFLIWI